MFLIVYNVKMLYIYIHMYIIYIGKIIKICINLRYISIDNMKSNSDGHYFYSFLKIIIDSYHKLCNINTVKIR